ncbi:MAG: cupin domain-containing protein [Caulobacter sp.]|nr:cupin domain-containing protein [Caulobacter sp.]
MKAIAFAAVLALGLAAPAMAQAPEAVPLGKYDVTNTGQPIVPGDGAVEVTVTRVTIPAGATLPVHKHPHQRFGFVESGRIRVSNLDTGTSVEYGPGETIIEARGQWHTGTALGDVPVVLLVIDQTPPGEGNTVMREAE